MSRLTRHLELAIKSSWYKEKWNDILEFLEDYIIYPIKEVYRGISNIIRYLPIIYRDRDWDYTYLLQLLHFKISNMHNYFTSDRAMDSTSLKATIKQLKITKDTLEKIIDGDYVEEDIANHFKLYPMIFKTENRVLRNGETIEVSILESSKESIRSFRKIMTKEARLRKKYHERLFNYLSKYEKWWD